VSTVSLLNAIKTKSDLLHRASNPKLVVVGSDKTEIDLEDLQREWRKQGISFSFAKLISDYNINYYSPILAQFPGQ
jgi:aryl carrier-like protein